MTMLQGPRKELCPCGPPSCGLFGTPLRGKVGHIRGCPCRRCGGKRSRRTGLDAQRKAAKAVGIKRVGSFFPGHEEHYGGALRIESKAGAQVKAAITAYLKAEEQSENQRPIGDHRPFLMAATDDRVALGIFRLDQAANIAAALAENLGLLVGEDAEDPADHGRDVRRPGQVEPGLAEPGLASKGDGGVEDVHHVDHTTSGGSATQ